MFGRAFLPNISFFCVCIYASKPCCHFDSKACYLFYRELLDSLFDAPHKCTKSKFWLFFVHLV